MTVVSETQTSEAECTDDDLKSTKHNIFKLILDNGLEMWLFNVHGY